MINKFIGEQLAEWQTAADNFEALKGVKVKELDVDGMKIKVQFNPARIISSSAKVDAKSLAERKCFLCAQNRPSVQRGIEWGNGYIVFINNVLSKLILRFCLRVHKIVVMMYYPLVLFY